MATGGDADQIPPEANDLEGGKPEIELADGLWDLFWRSERWKSSSEKVICIGSVKQRWCISEGLLNGLRWSASGS
jgi:hypothetical protein